MISPLLTGYTSKTMNLRSLLHRGLMKTTLLQAVMFCPLITLLPPSVAAAQEPASIADVEELPTANWYEVDVLVFSQDSQSRELELPPAVQHHGFPVDSVTLYKPQPDWPEGVTPPDLERDPLLLLPDEGSSLHKAARSMRWSRGYHVFWRGSWRMPLERDGEPVSILINAGEQVGRNHQVEGSITFSLKRYLHINNQLWLNTLTPMRPVDQVVAGAPWFIDQPGDTNKPSAKKPLEPLRAKHSTFNILPEWPADTLFYTENKPFFSSRRLALNKMIYLDNPNLGLLIKVTRYQPPEPLPEISSADENQIIEGELLQEGNTGAVEVLSVPQQGSDVSNTAPVN